MDPLHDRATASLLLRGVWVIAFVHLEEVGLVSLTLDRSHELDAEFLVEGRIDVAYLTPYGRYHKVASVVAVINQPVPVQTDGISIRRSHTRGRPSGNWGRRTTSQPRTL